MRHQRFKHRTIAPWPSDKPQPEVVASLVRYVGSAEHKSFPSPAGNATLRSDASRCDPRYTDFEQITEVLRTAIRRGCISAIFEGDFPKYAWGWLDGHLYEARLVNRNAGWYKAFRLQDVEMPRDNQHLLNWDASDA